MGGGTVGVADIYGMASKVGGVMSPLSIQNPNGADVAPITQAASGGSAGGGSGPALSVVALIIGLVVLRLALHAQAQA